MTVLLIDNYDSFTYNLAHGLAEVGAPHVEVRRHDAIDEDEAETLQPTHLVISPGPGRPDETGVSGALIRHFPVSLPQVISSILCMKLIALCHLLLFPHRFA